MRRFFCSLTLVFGVVTSVVGAVTQPGTGFAKPDVQYDHSRQIPDESDDNLLIIIVDGRAFEVDGYYILVYRQKTLMGIFYDIQSPRGLWTISRDPEKERAIAVAQEGDTIKSLAIQTGLDPDEFGEWGVVRIDVKTRKMNARVQKHKTHVDHGRVVNGSGEFKEFSSTEIYKMSEETSDIEFKKGEEISVPNVVLLTNGDMTQGGLVGAAGKFIDDTILGEMKDFIKDISGKATFNKSDVGSGYKVKEVVSYEKSKNGIAGITVAKLKKALKSKNLAGWYHAGHGSEVPGQVGDLVMFNEVVVSVKNLKVNYKLGFSYQYVCLAGKNRNSYSKLVYGPLYSSTKKIMTQGRVATYDYYDLPKHNPNKVEISNGN